MYKLCKVWYRLKQASKYDIIGWVFSYSERVSRWTRWTLPSALEGLKKDLFAPSIM
jgi:hypothetical protein